LNRTLLKTVSFWPKTDNGAKNFAGSQKSYLSMKLKVTVVFGQYERKFSIPCGTGNKTIKWLGIVASQRYSNAAPNGALRRRDDYCGITENAQYQVEHVYLPDGKIAHPGIMIYDSDLKDGDEVTVKLSSKIAVHTTTGTPTKTKWAMLAFSTSTIENPYLNSTRSEHCGDDDSLTQDDVLVGEDNKSAFAVIQSKAKFMRIILQSQMINAKKLTEKLERVWPRIAAGVPKLRDEDVPALKRVIESNWDMLSDLFEFYVDGPYIDKSKFATCIDDAEVFPAYNTAQQCAKIYARACAYTRVDEHHFDFPCLLIALMLAAQVKYNDTLEAGADALPAHEALDEMFRFHFLPVAERHSLQSVLKYAFCSDECLAYLRPMNDELQVIFNRYATRYQDVPLTITVEDLTEILCHAGLLNDPNDLSRTKTILTQIQKSTIYGSDEANMPSKTANDVSFPEYVEAVARAGFIKFFDPEGDAFEGDDSVAPGSLDGSVINSSVVGCLVMGARAVVDKNNSATAERHPTAAKNKRGGRK
jgi:hypothetical protein